MPVDVEAMGIDLLSLSAHKIYGPKGIGALYVRAQEPARAARRRMIDGGGHERGMRSGTLNVPGIVGLGKACELGRDGDGATRRSGCSRLRERLREGIIGELDEVYLNGHPTERLPGNLNISFAYVEGEALMMGSSRTSARARRGSACTSASLEPSYVLKALGVGDELAHTRIRFGLGRFNTEEEVDYVVERVVSEVQPPARHVARSTRWPRKAST